MMPSYALRVLVPSLLLPVFMSHAGGWAVVTVDSLPDYVEAGKVVTLTYMVRQHGVEPHRDLTGRIEATSGRLTARGVVVAGQRPGQYRASITLPSAGDWSITLRSGFPRADVTIAALPAIAPGASLTRTITDAERGERLFAAKGCVTCHVQIDVGPRLEGRRFDPAYISGFIANPPRTPTQRGRPAMPNLGLEQREIASLVAYLNTPGQLGAR
jgi:mono/diheme cytochrome c family protein